MWWDNITKVYTRAIVTISVEYWTNCQTFWPLHFCTAPHTLSIQVSFNLQESQYNVSDNVLYDWLFHTTDYSSVFMLTLINSRFTIHVHVPVDSKMILVNHMNILVIFQQLLILTPASLLKLQMVEIHQKQNLYYGSKYTCTCYV